MKPMAESLLVGWLLLISSAITTAQQPSVTIRDSDVKLVSFVDLSYPRIAAAARVQGLVVVRVTLDDHGTVVCADALSGSEGLIADALANARKWRFQPNAHRSAIIVYDFQFDNGACHDRFSSLFVLRHWNHPLITACLPVIDGVVYATPQPETKK